MCTLTVLGYAANGSGSILGTSLAYQVYTRRPFASRTAVGRRQFSTLSRGARDAGTSTINRDRRVSRPVVTRHPEKKSPGMLGCRRSIV